MHYQQEIFDFILNFGKYVAVARHGGQCPPNEKADKNLVWRFRAWFLNNDF